MFRDGQLRQLTDDHSWIAEQLRSGSISEAEAKSSKFRHVITKSIGFERDIDADVKSVPVSAGDCFVLCSDGMSNYIEHGELERIVAMTWYRKLPATLIELANGLGMTGPIVGGGRAGLSVGGSEGEIGGPGLGQFVAGGEGGEGPGGIAVEGGKLGGGGKVVQFVPRGKIGIAKGEGFGPGGGEGLGSGQGEWEGPIEGQIRIFGERQVRGGVVGGVLGRGKLVGAEDVDAAFELLKKLVSGEDGGVIVGDEHLIAAVEGGFDGFGVFDIDAKQIGDQAADEGILLLTLAEDGFDAFADALAFGFQILEELLTGEEAGTLFAGGA
jgi:hypothetical protein